MDRYLAQPSRPGLFIILLIAVFFFSFGFLLIAKPDAEWVANVEKMQRDQSGFIENFENNFKTEFMP